jgi:hypothetical protein
MNNILKDTEEYLKLKELGFFPEAITEMEISYWQEVVKLEEEKAKTDIFDFVDRPTKEDMDDFFQNWDSQEYDTDLWVDIYPEDYPDDRKKWGIRKDSPSCFMGEVNNSVQIGKYIIENKEEYGGEGQGDDYWFVFSIHNADSPTRKTYWKIYGWYASHAGGELEYITEVKPVQVTRTEWQ